MKIINYISGISIPLIIVFVVGIGIKEKKKVYDIFIELPARRNGAGTNRKKTRSTPNKP